MDRHHCGGQAREGRPTVFRPRLQEGFVGGQGAVSPLWLRGGRRGGVLEHLGRAMVQRQGAQDGGVRPRPRRSGHQALRA
eukprot:10948550-Lingulodinium_polyedra.AAC.1